MRVLVTVGAQMPFDRLVGAVDRWAERCESADVFAQIGDAGLVPRHMAHTRFLSPRDYLQEVERATVLVAHAGMGSILTALEHGKPIVVMPRRGDLAETRNDHQLATAKAFCERGCVAAVYSDRDLAAVLDDVDALESGAPIPSSAPRQFLDSLRAFALEGRS